MIFEIGDVTNRLSRRLPENIEDTFHIIVVISCTTQKNLTRKVMNIISHNLTYTLCKPFDKIDRFI